MIDIFDIIEKMKCQICCMPNDELKKGTKKGTKTSYEQTINTIIDAIQKSKKWTKDIKKSNKKKDCYQVWLDSKNRKLYVSIFYGSRIAV